MIKEILIFVSNSFLPYQNQAMEFCLFDKLKKGQMIFYLWQNNNTVFVGKNQDVLAECNLEALKKLKGFIARRKTGGGAVFHDKGNLNFSFIQNKEDYDLNKNFKLIQNALKVFNINCEVSGRNDLQVNKKKFSGNAFFKSQSKVLHHGTILINCDFEKMSKILTVSKIKLDSKNVKSVKSRVINLKEINSSLTVSKLKKEIINGLKQTFFCNSVVLLTNNDVNAKNYNKWLKFFSDKSNIYNKEIEFDKKISNHFEWGNADLYLKLKNKKILNAKIYSDSLDCNFISSLENYLKGLDFNTTDCVKSAIKEFIPVLEVIKNGI